MDERVSGGFLSIEKPIYRVGFSAEIVELYESALRAAQAEAAYSQQLLAGIVGCGVCASLLVHAQHIGNLISNFHDITCFWLRF